MKKINSIQLGGIIFHIEEDAYRQLRAYLTSVRKRFHGESADEISTDIESRIAELLQEKSEGIITTVLLEEVFNIIGQPQDFADADAAFAENEIPSGNRYRRLYRNPQDKTIAGVCGGLGSYFDVDPLLFRIGFFLTIFVGGFGLMAYLILWLLVPMASSMQNLKPGGRPAIDRLREGIRSMFNYIAGLFRKSLHRDQPQQLNIN